MSAIRLRRGDGGSVRHTPDNDINNQNNESDNSTSSSVLPCSVLLNGDLVGDRSGEGESGQHELKEGVEETHVVC